MLRSNFDKQLDELHINVIKMGSIVEESIDNTMLALKNQDIKLAQKIFMDDDIIDDYEQRIERDCLKLIAMQQPLAVDLRSISTALKIITDMERIGDHASDIAELTIRMAKEKYIRTLIDIPKMADMAKVMLKNALESYTKQDLNLAKKVCKSDDDVDDMFKKIIFDLINIMKNNPQAVEQCINFMFITKYLERIADHATNIGEWVVYNVTGEHSHLAKFYHKTDRKRNPFVKTDENNED